MAAAEHLDPVAFSCSTGRERRIRFEFKRRLTNRGRGTVRRLVHLCVVAGKAGLVHVGSAYWRVVDGI